MALLVSLRAMTGMRAGSNLPPAADKALVDVCRKALLRKRANCRSFSRRLPVSPVQNIVRETMDRTEAAWRGVEQKDILPEALKKDIGGHIKLVLKNSRSEFQPAKQGRSVKH